MKATLTLSFMVLTSVLSLSVQAADLAAVKAQAKDAISAACNSPDVVLAAEADAKINGGKSQNWPLTICAPDFIAKSVETLNCDVDINPPAKLADQMAEAFISVWNFEGQTGTDMDSYNKLHTISEKLDAATISMRAAATDANFIGMCNTMPYQK